MAPGAASDLAFPFPPPWSENISVQFNISSSSSFHLSSKTKYPRYPHLSVKRSRCSPISLPHFERLPSMTPSSKRNRCKRYLVGAQAAQQAACNRSFAKSIKSSENPSTLWPSSDDVCQTADSFNCAIAGLKLGDRYWLYTVIRTSGLLECVIKPSSLLYHNFHNCWRENPYHSCQYDGKV